MRRKLFTLAAGVSAVIFLASVIGWVESYHTARLVYWSGARPGNPADGFATSVRGITYLTRRRYLRYPQPHVRPHEFVLRAVSPEEVAMPADAWSGAGFQYKVIRAMDRVGESIAVPYWFWTAISALMPPIWVMRRRRNRERRAAGRCQNCGYDLRATPDRCPECGTVPAPTASLS
jgi:hypothetical protein